MYVTSTARFSYLRDSAPRYTGDIIFADFRVPVPFLNGYFPPQQSSHFHKGSIQQSTIPPPLPQNKNPLLDQNPPYPPPPLPAPLNPPNSSHTPPAPAQPPPASPPSPSTPTSRPTRRPQHSCRTDCGAYTHNNNSGRTPAGRQGRARGRPARAGTRPARRARRTGSRRWAGYGRSGVVAVGGGGVAGPAVGRGEVVDGAEDVVGDFSAGVDGDSRGFVGGGRARAGRVVRARTRRRTRVEFGWWWWVSIFFAANYTGGLLVGWISLVLEECHIVGYMAVIKC